MVKKFLILDTSGPDSFVALHHSSKELEIKLLPPLKQSQTLLPTLEKLLQNQEIDFIAIGTGPGSFTGTRVGVMTAKTLSFARNIPLVPFCSLKCYLPTTDGSFTITTDAKSHGFYTLKGTKKKEVFSFEKPLLQKEPSTIPELNLSALANILLQKLETEGTITHNEIQVTYLHTP